MIDLVQPAKISGERARLAFDALLTEILEQIVVRMDAVQRRVRRMRLVEITEQVVDEVGSGSETEHLIQPPWRPASPDEPITLKICQWYNKAARPMPGTLFVVATPIGNLEDIMHGPCAFFAK